MLWRSALYHVHLRLLFIFSNSEFRKDRDVLRRVSVFVCALNRLAKTKYACPSALI
jgi:hypothetical protein